MILMNAPRRPDGPPVRDGKPYSAVAHLAEDVVPYVAVAAGLRNHGFSAPDVLQADLDHGLLLVEDLGDDRVVAGDPPRRSRSAIRSRSTYWQRCTASACPRCCARRRSASIGCRATTSRRF